MQETTPQFAIRVHDLVVGFGRHVVIDHLSLDVRKGEILGLVGASGGGKSVLMRTIIGLIPRQGGEIEVMGAAIGDIHDRNTQSVAGRWGILFQQGALFSSLTVRQNIQFPLRENLVLSDALMDEIATAKLEMVGLTPEDGDKFPAELSGGMTKRVALARALALDPAVVFLDEPTSGLDPIGTAEIKNLIRDLREQGKTIVLSGHLLADMQDICDRIAILHRGELKELGRVSDLLTVQDVTQIKARNLSPAALEEIRDVILRHGGEDVVVDHPTTTLEELFLRIVHESDLHPGRRKVGHDAGKPAAPVQGELAAQAKR
jgi:phospholipid/cholesterol/gamma-HCH transport system ATP-binding protein